MFKRLKNLYRINVGIAHDLRTLTKSVLILRQLAMNEIIQELRVFARSKQMNFIETLEFIEVNKVSLARFGDGELKAMLRTGHNLRFQKNSVALQQELLNVVAEGEKNPTKVLVALPHIFSDTHWMGIWADVWPETKTLFENLPRLGNAHVSRPIFFEETGQSGIDAWKVLWKDKSVTVITGYGSRFDLIPELFNEVKSATFLFSKPKDAFDDLDRIVAEAKKDPADLFLISLGPAGTVLASKLASEGRWALDVGHLSDSYRNVYEGAPRPEHNPLVKD